MKKYAFLAISGVLSLLMVSFSHAALTDEVAGATAGYSFRTIRGSYVGPLVQIRRTDGEKANVYADTHGNFSFASPVTVTSGSSTAVTLGPFITGTDAYVETWYDQVGSNNVTQSTQASQPKIVTSGAIISSSVNSLPAVQFDGVDDGLLTSGSLSFPQPFTVFSVNSADTQTSSAARLFEVGASTTRALYQYAVSSGMYAGSFLPATLITSPHTTRVSSMVFNTTSSQLFTNGGSGTTPGTVGTQSVNGPLRLSTSATANSFKGTISEFVIYATSLTSPNRQTIENNQIAAFVTPISTTALGVTGALHAYGVRQLVSTYALPLVRIRRTDGGMADVYADLNGIISLTSPITVTSGASSATTLAAFVTETDAYVETWYDQVGVRNVTQSTQASQPKIVTSGAIITSGQNSKPTVQFDGSDDTLTSATSLSTNQPITVSMVSTAGAQTGGVGRPFLLGLTPNNITYQVGSSGGMFSGSFLASTLQTTPYTTQLATLIYNSTSSQLFVNGTSVASGNTGTKSVNGGAIDIGSNGGVSYFFNGSISEFILYNKAISGGERSTIEGNQIPIFITNTSTPLAITSPSRAVSAEPSVATISYVDQKGLTVSIPYIQTSTTLNTSASVGSSLVPSSGGIKFVLNEGVSGETTIYDMSLPYTAGFTGLAKGTYTLDTYVVDSSQVVVSGANYHDRATNIGIGDIYVAIGDSITKGAGGVSTTDCIASGDITNWTHSLSGTVSTDKRNFCQWSSQQPLYFKSWMTELNNELAEYNGYPVFILNEGYGGYTAAGYLTSPMGLTSWQTRVSGLSPNKFLVMLGTNDNTSTSVYTTNMTAIVNALHNTYGASYSNIYVAKPPYVASRPVVETYLTPIVNLISSLNLKAGPNFWDFFFNHPELYYDSPPIHPNATGYFQMSRLWGLTLISPKNLSASMESGGVNLTWDSLASYDAIPNGTSEIAGYRVKYGTTPGTYATTIDVGNTTSRLVTGLTPGQTYYFTVDAYGVSADNAYSAQASEVSQTYSPELTPPTISLTSPSTSSTQSGTISITATAADNVGVVGVQFKLDGDTLQSEDTSDPYSISWDTTGTSDGSHTLTATARDGAGNSTTSSTVTITIDNTAPIRSAGAPSGTLSFGTTSTTLSLTTSETAVCKFSTNAGTAYGSMTSFTNTNDTAHTHGLSGLSNGTAYTYYVKCADTFGNTNSTNYSISFAIAADAASPTVSITSPITNTTISGTITISADATDNVAVLGVQFKLDGSNLQSEDTTDPYSISFDTTSVSDGGYLLSAVARDGNSNSTTSASVGVTIDNTPPLISSATATSITASTATITYTTDEPTSTQVDYGTDTSYGSQTTLSPTLVLSHSTALSGLTACTLYHYRPRATDEAGNDTTDTDHTFTTAGCVTNTAPVAAAGSDQSITLPTDTVTLSGTDSTDDEAITSYTWTQLSGPTATITAPTTATTTITDLSDGTFVFRLTVTDAEEESDTDEVTITVSPSTARRSSATGSYSITSPYFTTVFSSPTVPSTPSSTTFTRNLSWKTVGEDVKQLQVFLNTHGFPVAPTGLPGSLGKETSYFGLATKAALIKFQIAHNITPSVGFFGPVTRGVVNGRK